MKEQGETVVYVDDHGVSDISESSVMSSTAYVLNTSLELRTTSVMPHKASRLCASYHFRCSAVHLVLLRITAAGYVEEFWNTGSWVRNAKSFSLVLCKNKIPTTCNK